MPMSGSADRLFTGSDVSRIAAALAQIAGAAVEAIEASLPGALTGDRRQLRAYVAAHRELTARVLDAVGEAQPEARSAAPWLEAVLEREAMSTPFTDWVGTLGAGRGTAFALVARLRETLPGTEPLPLPHGRRLPAWGLDGAQIRRFLILHKELDADDGEITRTRKVRRGFVAQRYAPLVKALYEGAREADITTEVTFEDGRKGMLSARVKIRDVATSPLPAAMEQAA